jgi:hypothetical protein
MRQPASLHSRLRRGYRGRPSDPPNRAAAPVPSTWLAIPAVPARVVTTPCQGRHDPIRGDPAQRGAGLLHDIRVPGEVDRHVGRTVDTRDGAGGVGQRGHDPGGGDLADPRSVGDVEVAGVVRVDDPRVALTRAAGDWAWAAPSTSVITIPSLAGGPGCVRTGGASRRGPGHRRPQARSPKCCRRPRRAAQAQ